MHAATLSESQSGPSSQSEGCVSRGYYATWLMKARWCVSRHFANDLDASYLGKSPATFRHFPCCRQILQLPQFSIWKHTEYQVMLSLTTPTTLCSALTTTNHCLTPKERLVQTHSRESHAVRYVQEKEAQHDVRDALQAGLVQHTAAVQLSPAHRRASPSQGWFGSVGVPAFFH